MTHQHKQTHKQVHARQLINPETITTEEGNITFIPGDWTVHADGSATMMHAEDFDAEFEPIPADPPAPPAQAPAAPQPVAVHPPAAATEAPAPVAEPEAPAATAEAEQPAAAETPETETATDTEAKAAAEVQ